MIPRAGGLRVFHCAPRTPSALLLAFSLSLVLAGAGESELTQIGGPLDDQASALRIRGGPGCPILRNTLFGDGCASHDIRAALNQGGNAAVISVSCAAAGNCAAGGYYLDSAGHGQVFVAGEVNGTWHAAIEVPGTAALNSGGQAVVSSVSCASAGNCAAGGVYTDSSRHGQAFVVNKPSSH